MRIYHGSLVVIEAPEIRKPYRTLDYGAGFYATTSREQAEMWVRRRLNENDKAYINVYEFDESLMKDLKCLLFDLPTEEWVDFVMKNRMQNSFEHDYDIVYGPVANDKVYTAFALFESGIIDKQTLISELKTYKLVDQYLFHTERALNSLEFIEVKEVKL